MTQNTQTKALSALGYSLIAIRNNPSLFPSSVLEDADSMVYVGLLLSKLDALDSEIFDNLSDSMAEEVQDIKLNYNRYLIQANMLGNKLLKQLAIALGTPILQNKYGGSVGSSAVLNYY